jgi:uncharacterized protein (DUF58 family)
MARLLTRGGNRVGAILYDTRSARVIPPRAGRNQVLRLIHDLLLAPDRAGKAQTDLRVLLDAALGALKRRSLLFLVSDFISEPGWERPLSQLARRHELVAVRLWDEHEVEMPDAGFIYMEDAETGEQLGVDTSDPAFRQTFRELAEGREAALRQVARRPDLCS